MRTSILLLGTSFLLAAQACATTDSGSNGTGAGGSATGSTGAQGAGGAGGTPFPPPDKPPALSAAPLTTEQTVVPAHAISTTADLDPRVVADMDQMLSSGYGDTSIGPGEPVTTMTLDGSTPPPPGPNAKLLARFVHLADIQLADDESPARLASFDSPGLTAGAYRPQEGHECKILNAAVRTINRVHQDTPVDFVLMGGDNIDNAQQNELDWFLAIMGGSKSVECDSGKDDDPVSGPMNDPKDPFYADGLVVPWLWVTGNHDVLSQGNIVTSVAAAKAIGSDAVGGTRDWSKSGAPVVTGSVASDARRQETTRATMLSTIAADGDGHGVTSPVIPGKAYYAYDTPGGVIRMIVLDTGAETGGSDGVIHQADVDAFIKPALDQAKLDGKMVVLTSHHVSFAIGDGGDFGGTTQPDAITPAEWITLVGGYDNVIMHIAGHTHVHRVTAEQPVGLHAYWELETSALADFPSQMRLVEITDQDNGFVSIRAIAFDYQTEKDSIAADGRKRGVVDHTSGWGQDGTGDPAQHNVELWIPKPP